MNKVKQKAKGLILICEKKRAKVDSIKRLLIASNFRVKKNIEKTTISVQ